VKPTAGPGLLRAGLAAALLFFASAVSAHSFHFGLTEVTFNPRTGSTEVVHSYMSHDVEALLVNLYQRQFDLAQDEDAQVLRRYIDKQFYLVAADGQRLPLKWLGLTIAADQVVIYQEAEHTMLAQVATIHDDVLSDFLAEQVNTVTVGAADGPLSLTFGRQVRELPVRRPLK
jgi:hypothetical protein